MKKVAIGLVGFGTVGSGVARILLERRVELSARSGVDLVLKRIVDLDTTSDRGLTLPPGLLTDNLQALLDDPEISVVVELVGGTTVARTIVLDALKRGKAVVTANKALLAVHGREILEAASVNGTSVSFEASTAGGVPVIMTLRDGLVANRVHSIIAILNGTANYILTRMTESHVRYETALAEAQAMGYAEADPSLDVSGGDTAHKLAILARIAFGVDFDFRQIFCQGINGIDLADIEYAAELGYVIKLLAVARRLDDTEAAHVGARLDLRVHPTLLPAQSVLAGVRGSNNAILIHGDAVGNILLHGRGAGRMPTASAVVSDLIDVALGKAKITFDSFRVFPGRIPTENLVDVSRTQGSYYVRFSVLDHPGVLAGIAGVLAQEKLSILSVIQKEARSTGSVPIVMMTELAEEAAMARAMAQIDRMPFVTAPSVWMRVQRPEDNGHSDLDERVDPGKTGDR